MYEWSDDENDSAEEEWRAYHERCCQEGGDGWSHGFLAKDLSALHSYKNHFSSETDMVASHPELVHEPKKDVVKHFTIENWSKMGRSLATNPFLKFVDLSNCGLTEESITALFGEGRLYEHCSLKKLNLGKNPFGPNGTDALRPFLRTHSEIVFLGLDGTNLGNRGAYLLSEALNHSRIEYLHLQNNFIGDEGLEHLLSATNSAHILELSIAENEIGPRGYEAISSFLQRDDTELKKLSANCSDENYARRIIDSISKNSKLEDIYLWSGNAGNSNRSMIAALPNLQNLICNASSLQSLWHSNHQIKWLGMNTDTIIKSNQVVEKALDINARSKYGATMIKVVRSKLRTFYFTGDYCILPFLRMDLKLMPYLLELVTKTEVCEDKSDGFLYFGKGTYTESSSKNLSGVYRLVRNCHLALDL